MDSAILVELGKVLKDCRFTDEKVKDRLTIHFQKQSNGGGDVDKVLYPLQSSPNKAIVVFSAKRDMERLTARKHQVAFTNKITITVEAERLPQVFTSIKVVVNPFYLNLLPRDKTDILQGSNPSKIKVTCPNNKAGMSLEVQHMNDLQQAENLLFDTIGLDGSHAEEDEEGYLAIRQRQATSRMSQEQKLLSRPQMAAVFAGGGDDKNDSSFGKVTRDDRQTDEGATAYHETAHQSATNRDSRQRDAHAELANQLERDGKLSDRYSSHKDEDSPSANQPGRDGRQSSGHNSHYDTNAQPAKRDGRLNDSHNSHDDTDTESTHRSKTDGERSSGHDYHDDAGAQPAKRNGRRNERRNSQEDTNSQSANQPGRDGRRSSGHNSHYDTNAQPAKRDGRWNDRHNSHDDTDTQSTHLSKMDGERNSGHDYRYDTNAQPAKRDGRWNDRHHSHDDTDTQSTHRSKTDGERSSGHDYHDDAGAQPAKRDGRRNDRHNSQEDTDSQSTHRSKTDGERSHGYDYHDDAGAQPAKRDGRRNDRHNSQEDTDSQSTHRSKTDGERSHGYNYHDDTDAQPTERDGMWKDQSKMSLDDQDTQSTPQQRGPFGVNPLLYLHLIRKHGGDIKNIETQHNVSIVKVGQTNSNNDLMAIIGVKQIITSQHLYQAEEEFITFYKHYFDLYHVKLDKIPSTVTDERLHGAVDKISQIFPDVSINTDIDGEIAFVGKNDEVSQVMTTFRKEAGIHVDKSRRLRGTRRDESPERVNGTDDVPVGNFVNVGRRDDGWSRSEDWQAASSGSSQNKAFWTEKQNEEKPQTHNQQQTRSLDTAAGNSHWDDHQSGARSKTWDRKPTSLNLQTDDSFWTDGGVEILIEQKDITSQRADIIVNASNETLSSAGGVATAIYAAAGPELQKECYDIRSKRYNYRPLSIGECVVTKGYKLPCTHVIHVVGPMFSYSSSREMFYQELRDTFVNCLGKVATLPDIRTIAIPLVSSGNIGGPKDVCAAALIDALLQCVDKTGKKLQKVFLINKDDGATTALREALKVKKSNNDTQPMEVDSDEEPNRYQSALQHPEHSSQSSRWDYDKHPTSSKQRKTFQSTSGLKITVVEDQVQNCSGVDGMINVSSDASFQSGLGKVIADAAGGRLVQEYKEKSKAKPFAFDEEIVVTRGYLLGCGHVLHILIPKGDSRTAIFNRVCESVLKCLKYADLTLKLHALMIPMGNYDGGDHTPELYAEAIANALKDFSQLPVRHLKAVDVVHPKSEMCMAMESAFYEYFKGGVDDGHLFTGAGARAGAGPQATSRNEDKQGFERKTSRNQYKITDNDDDDWGRVDKKEDSGDDNEDEEEKRCPICFDDFEGRTDLKVLDACKHKFCKKCIDKALEVKPMCPLCGKVYGVMKGTQPNGTMRTSTARYTDLPGYAGCGYITINYSFSGGTQGPNHPTPGSYYSGTSRTAYLPNNTEGQKVLKLLKKAFDARLIFTIGTSVTTGMSGTVTWNDIHHKTSMTGGPQCFGYPDKTYLSRVTEELAAKGIK